MSQKLTNKLVKFKNAVMILGLHGVLMVHVPIMDGGHTNNSDGEADSFEFLRVHKKENRFIPYMKRRIVVIMAIGELVSSKRGLLTPICKLWTKNPQTGYMVERHLWTKNPHKFFFKKIKNHLLGISWSVICGQKNHTEFPKY